MREDYFLPPEPPEDPPFCDRCFGYHHWNAPCPDEYEDDDDA